MKFYYNGKLMRTSQSHHYTHALIDENGECKMCSATYEGCYNELRWYVNREETCVSNDTSAIEAIKGGKKEYLAGRAGKKSMWKIRYSLETYEKSLELGKSALESYKSWSIVELTEEA